MEKIIIKLKAISALILPLGKLSASLRSVKLRAEKTTAMRDREDNKNIIKEVLEKVSLILAPFAPYISENIYSQFSKNSVHLSKWPEVDVKKIDKKLEKEFETMLQIIEKGFALRTN